MRHPHRLRWKLFPEWLSKNALLLSLTSLLNDISSEMIFPILPIFLTTILGAPPYVLGLVEGSAHVVETLLRGASGFAADRMKKRKPLILIGYAFSAVTKPLFAMAYSWPFVLLVRVADRAGKGVRVSPRDALLAAESHGSHRGGIFGFRKAADSTGAIIGPLVCFGLLTLAATWALTPDTTYRLIFLVSFVPAFCALTMLLGVEEKSRGRLNPASIRSQLTPPPGHWRNFLILSSLFGLGQISYAFFVLRAVNLGIGAATITLLYVLFNAVYALAAIPSGMLSDKWGPKAMLFFTFLTFALTCLAFNTFSSLLGLALAFALYGVFMGAYETVARVYIAEHFSNAKVGGGFGAYNMALGFTALPAGLIAGLLYPMQFFGFNAAFAFGAVISLISAAGIWLMLGGKNQNPSN